MCDSTLTIRPDCVRDRKSGHVRYGITYFAVPRRLYARHVVHGTYSEYQYGRVRATYYTSLYIP